MGKRQLRLPAPGQGPHIQDAEILRHRFQRDHTVAHPGGFFITLLLHQPLRGSTAEGHILAAVGRAYPHTPALIAVFRQKVPRIELCCFLRQPNGLLPVPAVHRFPGFCVKLLTVQEGFLGRRPEIGAGIVENQPFSVFQSQLLQGVPGPADVILQRAHGVHAFALMPEQINEFFRRHTPVPMQNQIGHQRPQPLGPPGQADDTGPNQPRTIDCKLAKHGYPNGRIQ